MSLAACVFLVPFMFGLYYIPESPPWLVYNEEEDLAFKSMAQIRSDSIPSNPTHNLKLFILYIKYLQSLKKNKPKLVSNFIYIFPKSFMIFCQELHNPKRNYENQS